MCARHLSASHPRAGAEDLGRGQKGLNERQETQELQARRRGWVGSADVVGCEHMGPGACQLPVCASVGWEPCGMPGGGELRGGCLGSKSPRGNSTSPSSPSLAEKPCEEVHCQQTRTTLFWYLKPGPPSLPALSSPSGGKLQPSQDLCLSSHSAPSSFGLQYPHPRRLYWNSWDRPSQSSHQPFIPLERSLRLGPL